ncbi:MAG: hypothetical protein CVU41_01295 [Chloroflexi bacterium HGW-Chloroflexi-3]|nr:MAG: hypothetical protein CVU41_01295 [Chloroflexi bacterium HGW-Chloroflexi-3]
MQVNQNNWHRWAQYLQRYHLLGLFRFLLDAAGPVRIVAAQSLWMTQPFVQNSIISQLAEVLEDQEQSKAFLEYVNNREFNE